MKIDDLFNFPIVMVDGENEERKEKDKSRYGDIPGKEDDTPEYDIVYGEATYPYYQFLGAEDRWLPTQRSLKRALSQRFDACIVRFLHVGQLLVPMTKEKFLTSIREFAYIRENNTIKTLSLEMGNKENEE